MAEKIINIQVKQDGQQLAGDEVNTIAAALNETYTLAKISSHSLYDGDFIIDGVEITEDGIEVPVVKINPAVFAASKIHLDPTQFSGDGTIELPYRFIINP